MGLEKRGWKVFRVLNSDLEDREMLEILLNEIGEALSNKQSK